ncbi:hypothetical protein C211_20712 [Stutzerimonas degradans]|nr:hypothetical protein C211_20712 [Stutzerimonas degradans]
MPAAVPDARRACQQVERQRQRGEGQVGQVIDQPHGIDLQQAARPAGRVRPVGGEQHAAGEQEHAQPEAEQQGQVTKLSMAQKRHRMIPRRG